MAVTDVPEILGMVVEVPGGAGKDFAVRDFEENGVDDTILIVCGLIGEARDEAVDDEGDEKMLVVNVVQGKHGAAVEKKFVGEVLKTEVFEGDAKRGLGAAGEEGQSGKQDKPRQYWARGAGCRNGGLGNRHDTCRVSLLI